MSAISPSLNIANRVCARTAVESHGVCRAPRKGSKKLSTLQAGLPFEWKQEVNRRIAEHRNRKGAPITARTLSVEHRSAGQRGAAAAARVAERFSHAPRYTETLVDDARTVSRAEAAQAADAAAPEPAVAMFAQPAELAPVENGMHQVATAERLEPAPSADLHSACAETRLFGSQAAALYEPPAETWDTMDVAEEEQAEAEPAHANLIEFPREVVATRKMRPRLVEGPYAASRDAQLSIFEVDPEAVSTEAPTAAVEQAARWNEPEWSGIKLDAQPEPADAIADVAQATAEIELAPANLRLLALVVDATLIAAAVLATGAVFALNSASLPGPRATGIAGAVAFVAIAALYEVLFLTLGSATPGMKYACLGLSTFASEQPTREQRWRRLRAMAVSLLPVGLGLVWMLFDEERLSWHDRFSQTYLKSSF